MYRMKPFSLPLSSKAGKETAAPLPLYRDCLQWGFAIMNSDHPKLWQTPSPEEAGRPITLEAFLPTLPQLCYSCPIMQRPFFWFPAALVLCSACLPAAAQKFQAKDIIFNGAPEYSEQELLTAGNLKKGSILTVDEMKTHFQLLLDTGAFETITYKFDGLNLIYTMTPAPLMYPVRLENIPLIPGKDLDAKIHERLPLYHGKVPSEGGLLQGVKTSLEEILSEQGIKASVTVMPFGTPGTKDVTAMNFAIASPSVRVGAIQVEGVSPEMETEVADVVKHASGVPFDTLNSQTNLEHIFASFYQENGYAAVKVSASRSNDLAITPEAVSVPFALTVQEGHVYKLGAVHLPAGSVVTKAEIQKTVAGRADPAATGLALRNIWVVIASLCRSKGYLDCAVTPHPELDEAAGVVNYTVDVNSGPVYHMALLKFENVSDDLRKLLMRNWQLFPGDPFDPNYVGGFIPAAMKADPVLQRTLATVKSSFQVQADPQTHEVNVVIRLQAR
jgi:outer membrane protein assembly factor BamA